MAPSRPPQSGAKGAAGRKDREDPSLAPAATWRVGLTGSITQHIAFPLSYEYHACLLANRAGARPTSRCFVTGPLCSPEDILYRNWELPELKEGDLLAVMDASAYFTSFASNFSFPRPAVVMVSNGAPALVRQRDSARGARGSSNALLISSLSQKARFTLLNVALGDQATLGQRACGCPLESLGWTTHLHTIRGYEKLIGGGMTFLGADVIAVLDEVLPSRFGSGPTDYQLVEKEAEDGKPRIRLLVHPRLGISDEAEYGRPSSTRSGMARAESA
ncbi:MAG TPA: hypothetical protein VNO21_25780 [Polyangiaceae bacterium]|nr:hypothetical protein [Polyangiaceae bacterium]